ncbi:SLC13 family permease [Roseicella aerolata]|uniref:SLC13 family permease n=1 Tax=Roseicella aerolata TaxID=2883479 RepID=A0A9X1IEV7_9PROT|nr:SLC13 family permease [Roseicella aerolata]MCB4823485.1 SLC13 family permease [Roseicella aerolata]
MTESAQGGAAGPRKDAHSPLGLLLGLGLFAAMLLLPPPEGMSPVAWRVAAVAVLMASWWVTEAIPIPATGLLPLILFPLLGIANIGQASAPYADPLIFLFLGGFLVALALERWNLHRRIALRTVALVGTRPPALVGGFMLATAFLSMWVSNTATAVMMLPIGLSVIALLEDGARQDGDGQDGQAKAGGFATALLLGIAYAASIGGLGTLIGTPPNALLAGFMSRTYGVEIGFAQWMVIGVPLVVLLLSCTWLLLTRLVFALPRGDLGGASALLHAELGRLGPMSGPEKRVAVVFAAMAALWVVRPLLGDLVPGINDTGIAIAAALALFILPAGRGQGGAALLGWDAARRLPWGVLLLFGGGLSLAAAITRSGLAEWIGAALGGFGVLPVLIVVLVVTAAIVFLTELTSNTATAAAFLPLVASLAPALGADPFLLTIPTALAASCAFMMPVATPPNAIVYGSGHLTIAQMARAGFWLNLLSIAVIVGLAWLAVGRLFAVPG